MQAFQTAALQEITTRWSKDITLKDSTLKKQVTAAALDPRFRKLKLLTPEEKLTVQSKIQSLAQNFVTSEKENAAAVDLDSPPKGQSAKTALDSFLGNSDLTDSDGDTNQDVHNQAVTSEVM